MVIFSSRQHSDSTDLAAARRREISAFAGGARETPKALCPARSLSKERGKQGHWRRAAPPVACGAIAALAAAIAGCAAGAAPAPAVRPLMVRVPVLHETPCPVPALAHPALPITGLKPGSPPADTMRAYAAAVAILKGAVRERDAVLSGCARAAQAPAAQAEKTR